MQSTGVHNNDGMVSFWQTLYEFPKRQPSAVTSSFASVSPDPVLTSVETSVQAVHWMITNRGGFALLTGLVMVPSQFNISMSAAQNVIQEAAKKNRIESIKLTLEDGSHLEGIIYYPDGWKREDDSRAVLYHNPNGATIADFFSRNTLTWTVGEIARIRHCPIIMYDYRGTGLSQENSCTSLAFRPTYHSVVVDGTAMQTYALARFKYIEAWGSSLGGAVGTKALDAHLSKFPLDAKRVDWTNHDSLTTTSRVIIPSLGWVADYIGAPLGGNLDAETSMKALIQCGIKITVLCHQKDPVIPQGARMAELIESLGPKDNIRLIYSPYRGHANLSGDMLADLQKPWQPTFPVFANSDA